MSDYNSTGHELGWDDEIQDDGGPYRVLPEGDYSFCVTRFERARHGGSEKIPACNKAVLTLLVTNGTDHGTVQTSLLMWSTLQWKISQFLTSIGQKQEGGQAIRPNWTAVTGSAGRCHIGIRKWTGSDGKEREGNEITEFYEPEPAAQTGAFQELPNEQIPEQWQNSASQGGYTPGQF